MLTNVARSLATTLGYAGLPPSLLRYLLVISIVGPLAPIVVLLAAWEPLSGREAIYAILLLVMATVSDRYPLHLTHKTNINITTGAIIAMILLLPVWAPGMLMLVAGAIAQWLRRAVFIEASFNVSQTGLYVTVGAVCYDLLADLSLGPRVGEFGSVTAIVIAALVMHLVNTGLVALAGAIQVGVSPIKAWMSGIQLDLVPTAALTGLGTIAAVLAVDQPLVLPFLALPAILVHRAVLQTIQLRQDTHEALKSLVEIVELRDPYTAGHSRRVAELARVIARRMGLTEQEADDIELAGHVHDIGKVGIDPEILTKTGRLTDEEWEQMRLHPVLGADVIARFSTYRRGVKLVRHHHESLDGNGYPDRLAGDAIPLGARILAVADTYDALTTNRPYRSARTVAEAIAILEQGAGRQWDAAIVATLIDYLREVHGEAAGIRPVEPAQSDPSPVHSPAVPRPAR